MFLRWSSWRLLFLCPMKTGSAYECRGCYFRKVWVVINNFYLAKVLFLFAFTIHVLQQFLYGTWPLLVEWNNEHYLSLSRAHTHTLNNSALGLFHSNSLSMYGDKDRQPLSDNIKQLHTKWKAYNTVQHIIAILAYWASSPVNMPIRIFISSNVRGGLSNGLSGRV